MTNTIDKFIDEYLKSYRSFKENWNYEDGCVLKGAWDLYGTTKRGKFLSFVLNYFDEY